jgi:hypothetical protein
LRRPEFILHRVGDRSGSPGCKELIHFFIELRDWSPLVLMFLNILHFQKHVASGNMNNCNERLICVVGTFGGMNRVQKSFSGSFLLACQLR